MRGTIIFILFFVNNLHGQNLEYKEFTKEDKGNKYQSYLTKDSTEYKIGDFVKIGRPSSGSFKHIFIFQGMGFLPMSVSENHLLGEECKIIYISLIGSKKRGYSPFIKVDNGNGQFFSIYIEKGIEDGEIITKLSEDEVLELLEKEKSKLDLGIITKEEYEKRKNELIKELID